MIGGDVSSPVQFDFDLSNPARYVIICQLIRGRASPVFKTL